MNLEELRQEAEKAVAEAVRKHTIAINQLTEEQVVKVFKEAIASGDIWRNLCVTNGGQSVSYAPYMEKERLEARIKSLEDEIKALVNRDCRMAIGKWPVILYFETEAEKDAFVADVKLLQPDIEYLKV